MCYQRVVCQSQGNTAQSRGAGCREFGKVDCVRGKKGSRGLEEEIGEEEQTSMRAATREWKV